MICINYTMSHDIQQIESNWFLINLYNKNLHVFYLMQLNKINTKHI